MPNANTRVRRATPADWLAVTDLLVELGRPSVRGTESEAAAREQYERYLERSDAVAFVAELGGAIVGFVNLELRARLNVVTPQGWIADLIVTSAARSRGVGAALLAIAVDTGKERGCFGLALQSANWRKAAHRFYCAQGWDDSAHAFTKPLSDVRLHPPSA